MTALIALVVKGSILMIAAAAAVALLSRASAATRHFIWTLSVAGLLLLPLVASALPSWAIAVPIRSTEVSAPIDLSALAIPTASAIRNDAAAARPLDGESSSAASRVPWVLLPAALYVMGVLTLLVRLGVQYRSARRIARDAGVVTDPGWISRLGDCAMRIGVRRPVTLRRSRQQLMPMTIGTVAPVIVIPADADTWDDDRRTAVLLHELAHIARHDCLTQLLSAIATALYWVHPGVWYVARRLRIERELACDDCVLAAGAQARSYASHLLELAYGWSGRRAPALAVGMAGSRKLEGRMRAVLDPERNRRVPGRRAWVVGTALTAAVLLPIAVITTTTTTSADMRSSLMASGTDDTPVGERIERASDALPQLNDRSAAAEDAVSGTWETTPTRTSSRVRLRVRLGSASFNSDIDADELEGLTGQPLSRIDGPVRFSIPRDAGSFEIEGTLKAGAGSGTFRFVPSNSFLEGLTRRGFDRPQPYELMALAQHDIGFAFIDELTAQKYVLMPVVAELVRAAHHGVDLDFVRDMGQAGYRVGTLDALIRFRDHGVSPEFITDLRSQGITDLSTDDLVRARDHGVDAEFIRELRTLGYGQLPFDALVRARDHGVDGEYVRGMRQLGYTADLDEVIRARDHGVDPEYVGALRDAGYARLPLEDVIRTRDHGVDPDYLHEMRRLGYTLTLTELINVRDHGITPDYVEMMASVGYKGLPIETLIRLRDHGVTPDYVVEIQKRGFKNLSPDEIIRMRDRGVASSDYRVDRLIAYLRGTRLAREIEQLLAKSERHVDKLIRTVDQAGDKVDRAVTKASR